MSPLTLIPLCWYLLALVTFGIFCSFDLMTINLDTPHPIAHSKVLIMASSKDKPLPIEKEVQQLTGEGRFLLRPYFLFLWKWNFACLKPTCQKSLSLTLSPKRSCKKRTSNLRWSCRKIATLIAFIAIFYSMRVSTSRPELAFLFPSRSLLAETLKAAKFLK